MDKLELPSAPASSGKPPGSSIHLEAPTNASLIRQEYATNKSCPHQKRAKKLYTALRSNMVNTVHNSWEETGFAWEQYNPETGAGQRTQHFTGWTSLIVKVMTMPDLE